MASYFEFTEISTAWAAVSISGVTVKAASAMPSEVSARDCPMLAPAPNYISGLTVEAMSLGAPDQMRATCTYNMTYRYYHAPVGATRGLLDIYTGLLDKVDLIMSTAFDNSNLTDSIEFWPAGATAPTVVSDPAGNQFYGCDLTFSVITFVR